ncbi:MAG: prolyl oligopeptidase family serine peptidase [Verrucomicrobia bacterium]|nr:prolyl oligopeptidase family serine peptidase [Verrucomicrobiota bacterium]
MKQNVSLLFALFATAVAHADGPKDNQIDNVRRVPPPGIAVPEKDRAELNQGLAALGKEIESLRGALKGKPQLLDLLPDVEIFHKAVRYALAYDEFFKPGEITTAKAHLQTAMERAKSLREGKAPWANATGLVVRGQRSRLDGSVQPYALVVPESARAGLPLRLDIWFHGRGENLSEVNFLADHQKNPGQFTPPNTIVLHVYNRYCNPARFAGETDVFEAWAHLKKFYPVDENRVCVRGFSMGGASTWGFATHHAGLWAAAAPGAGFSETADFLKVFQNEELKPTWWEQKLWRLYDATENAINLYNVPLVVYSGEKDRQKQAADIMEKALAAEGIKMTHIIGPNTEHKYEPGAKAEVERRVDALAAHGRNPVPEKIKFTTYSLRYNTMFWLAVDALEEHWERARVDAELADEDNTVKLATKNVTALTLDFAPGLCPLDVTAKVKVILDGQKLDAPAPESDRSWKAHFNRTGKKWALTDDSALRAPSSALAKRHGLQGPIDDAFMDSFMFVRPTGAAMNAKVGAWVQGELQHALTHWRQQFRGDARVKNDADVTDADIASHNLVLWGDPQSNKLLAKIADKLPIQWNAAGVRAGNKSFPADQHVPVMIYPNPLNPKHYVVLNSSFTYREYDYLNNARQTPKLPDWAVVDISKPVTSRAPGGIAAAGFFGERWQVKKP